ncbi:glycosyltransferase [Streptomyces sp. NPDC059352]|uniref:glycosyltransferase n=1 Tax=Streptomyces sp. NPDC059352 TaxID=3346810 RepID=UPI00369FC8FB
MAGDPEAGAVLDDVIALRHGLPPRLRRRFHPLCTPLADDHGSSLLVNAPKRRADIVVQRSVQEAFGLTVTEAMFKARPVVAGAVGGIPRQIPSGQTGPPLKNPGGEKEFTGLVGSLLDDRETAARLGRAARNTAQAAFTVGREAADHGRIVRAFRETS